MPIEQIDVRREFYKQHGGEAESLRPYRIENGGKVYEHFFLFSDGARMEVSRYGYMLDPPFNPLERLTLIVRYWTIRVQQEEEAYADLKLSIVCTFDNSKCGRRVVRTFPGMTEEEAVAKLDHAEALVKRVRAGLAKAKAALDKLTEPQRKADAELKRMEAREREEHQMFADKIKRKKV